MDLLRQFANARVLIRLFGIACGDSGPSPDRRENPWHWEIAAQARNDKIGMIAGLASKKKTDNR